MWLPWAEPTFGRTGFTGTGIGCRDKTRAFQTKRTLSRYRLVFLFYKTQFQKILKL